MLELNFGNRGGLGNGEVGGIGRRRKKRVAKERERWWDASFKCMKILNIE